jgi:8-oxo-dGTP diphosphatase
MAERPFDIYKASGLIIQDRQLLATRTRGKSIWIQPGGKLEKDENGNYAETETQAVVRELGEELGITVQESTLEKIGDFFAEAAGQNSKIVKIAAYLVHDFTGEPMPANEVEAIRGFNSQVPADVELASILEHDILPELKARDLID